MAHPGRVWVRASGDPHGSLGQRESVQTTPQSYWGRKHHTNAKMTTRTNLRGGMQVHAVPETERALDASGQRLPWAYEYAE